MTLDFYFRVQWTDNRFNMPAFWEKMSSFDKFAGISLDYLITGVDYPLIWVPDLQFHDVADMQVMVSVSFDWYF